MKSLMMLWNTLAEELASWCGTCATRDIQTVSRRCEDEGLSFLTITLSNFATDFQKSLAQGFVDADSFLSFQKRAGLPQFLGGFLHLIFTPHDGKLRDDPSVDAIFAVRQLTLAFSKILVDCSPARVERAFQGYITCEQDLKQLVISDHDMDLFTRSSDALFSDMFAKADLDVYNLDIIPKHGPGATADRLKGNLKWDQKEWTERLEAILPFGEVAMPSWRYRYLLERVDFLEPGAERPVKVITVPKTLKTPRIIAIEPTCMQYVQQGILRSLMRAHRKDDLLHSVIGFDDQQPNRVLARHGSQTGSLATLDLSEASDRVSNQLVRKMLRRFPHLAEAVDASRSRKADVPGHGVVRLAKFASMGSALCFPFEAFVFTTIVFDAIGMELNRPVTRALLNEFEGRVRIYGDDIIVPAEFATSVRNRLETFGFKVNDSKSFSVGKFRESCGGDYYDGMDVTPIRVRRVLPSSLRDAQEVASTVATRNLFYERGLWQTAAYLDKLLDRVLNGRFPVVGRESSVLGRFSFLPNLGEKQCTRLHKPLVRGYVYKSPSPENQIPGEAALLKFHLVRLNSDEPIPDGHLSRSGRGQSGYLKLTWSSPS